MVRPKEWDFARFLMDEMCDGKTYSAEELKKLKAEREKFDHKALAFVRDLGKKLKKKITDAIGRN